MAQSPFSNQSIDQAINETQPNMDNASSAAISNEIKPSSGLPKALLGGMLGGDLADALSTNLGTTHGEVNPLLPKPGLGNFAGIMGTGVLKALLLNRLAHSHPTLAKTLAGGSIGLSGYDTTNNIMNDHGKALWPFNSLKAKQ